MCWEEKGDPTVNRVPCIQICNGCIQLSNEMSVTRKPEDILSENLKQILVLIYYFNYFFAEKVIRNSEQ